MHNFLRFVKYLLKEMLLNIERGIFLSNIINGGRGCFVFLRFIKELWD